MKHYRVYKLKEPHGSILKGKDLHASDDGEAIQSAQNDEECPVCEVWQGARKVGLVE